VTRRRPTFHPALTLENAVAFGLERNRVLRAVQKEVQAVNEQVRQAQADFFPKLDGSYTSPI